MSPCPFPTTITTTPLFMISIYEQYSIESTVYFSLKEGSLVVVEMLRARKFHQGRSWKENPLKTQGNPVILLRSPSERCELLYSSSHGLNSITAFQQKNKKSLLAKVDMCNSYRRRKWTRRHDFKSWTWLIAFHIALIPLGKVWIPLFSLQLWVNSRAD